LAHGNLLMEASWSSSAISRVSPLLSSLRHCELTHMHRTIISNESGQRCCQSNHRRQACGRPATVVFEVQKDIRRLSARGQYPHRDEYGKEARQVQDQDAALDEGESNSEECVEDDGEKHDRNRKQSCVPWLNAIIFIVQSNQALDDTSNHECHRGQEYLPADCAEPTRSIAQDFLVLWWRKLTDPVVLSACGGAPMPYCQFDGSLSKQEGKMPIRTYSPSPQERRKPASYPTRWR
jgi:hypothetical protein